MKKIYPEEKGQITINGHPMKWVMRRSKGESCFGIRGSRIFELSIWKNEKLTLDYDRAYLQKTDKEDEETTLCLSYLIDKFGKERKKEKKNG